MSTLNSDATVPAAHLLGARVRAADGELRATFQSATPFRHLVIDDFLERGFCRQLLDEFPPFEADCAIDENREVGRKAVHDRVRALGPAYARLDDLIQSREFLERLSAATGIPDLLYDPEYVGGGTHENLTGQSLDTHVDFNYHHLRHWHRRINLLLFLNHGWRESWGGVLELQKDPALPESENEKVRILPLFNRAVLFETTERSWHGFSAVALPEAGGAPRRGWFGRGAERVPASRKSVALYFYTRTRPEEETAPPRSTIYIDEALPPHVKPGATLSERDVWLIRSLIDRRDKHLRRLYNHEQMYCTKIQELEEQLWQAQGFLRARLPVHGAAELVGEATGIHDDLWTGRTLECRVRATAPVGAVRIDGHVPDRDAPVELRARFLDGEAEAVERFPAGAFSWTLPVDLAPGSEATLTVSVADPWTPSLDGTSVDDRELGFRLERLTFTPRD